MKGRKNSFEAFEHNIEPQTELSNGCSLAIRMVEERRNSPSSVVILRDLMDLMEKGILFYCLFVQRDQDRTIRMSCGNGELDVMRCQVRLLL